MPSESLKRLLNTKDKDEFERLKKEIVQSEQRKAVSAAPRATEYTKQPTREESRSVANPYYQPQLKTTQTLPRASSYLTGTPSQSHNIPYAASFQQENQPVIKSRTRMGEPYSFSQAVEDLGYQTEKIASGAAGAVEDALRFVSGNTNRALAGVLSLGGRANTPATDFLYKVARDTLENSYVDQWKQSIEERYNPSFVAQKIGGLSEAAGAMAPTLAASGIAAPIVGAGRLGTAASMTAQAAQAAPKIASGIGLSAMFQSVAGASTRQALREGAELPEAIAYGVGSGAIEAGAESMFAGIPTMNSGIISDLVRKAGNLPVVSKVADILGEGVEEVASGILNPILARMTYDEQAELANSDELLDSFISGAALSAVMNAGYSAAGLVDGVRSQRNLMAAEEAGLTPEQVGSWKTYNDAGKSGIPYEEVRQEDTRRVISDDVAFAAHAAGMNDVQTTAHDFRAAPETVTTATRSTRPGVIENAVSKIINQNERKNIDEIAKRAKVVVEFSDNVSASGEYRDGVIRINVNSDNPVQKIFVHELTHHLEQSKGYSDLVSVIEKNLTAGGIDSQVLRDNIKSEYAERGVQLDDDGANRELVAKYAEEFLFTDEASIQRLANQNRSLAQRIKDWIHGMVIKFKGTRQEKALLEAEKKYVKALKNTTSAQKTGKTQYSLGTSSIKMQKEYREAVERGDYESANRLLSETSEKRGYFSDADYRMQHSAPNSKDGYSARFDDLSIMFGDDIYTKNAIAYFGTGETYDRISVRAIQSARNNPDAMITVYRAVPSSVNDTVLRNGDWVTTARQYAEDHGERSLDGDYKILSEKVPAKYLYGNGDSIHEFGYDNGAEEVYQNVLGNAKTLGVTYDDFGNLIPLSQRFDTSNPDRRFSQGSSFDKLLRDAGYTQEADALQKAAKKYGTIQRGEMVVRDVRLPAQMDENTRVRRFARTAAESAVLSDEQAGEIGKAVAEGKFNYEPIQNSAARAHAENILSRGEQYASDVWEGVINQNKPASKNDIAVGEYLLKQAAEAGDTQRVVELAAQIAAEGTRAGQIVQAMSMLKRMDGAGQLISLDAMIKKMQKDLDRGKSGVFLQVPTELRNELAKAKGEEEINNALDKIYKNLAEQMPQTWVDKWNAWRYLAMLGNPRTHIRNLFGNLFFTPVIATKNVVGALVESGVDTAARLIGKQGIERTKTIRGNIAGIGGKARKFAIEDFNEVQDIIKGGGKMNPSDIIREQKRVFKFKPLEAFRRANFNALEWEDGAFLKYHYTRSLVQYLQANKVDMDSFNPKSNKRDSLTLQKAREYAINEAQKATYRDFSRTAQAISQASRNAGGAASIIIEGVLPFKKTPLNVLKRGIEYSPAGLIESVVIGSNKLRKGEISASEYIDRLSAGMTGTGISLLGMLLYKLGILDGGFDDDKEDELRRSLGAQEYAVKVGNQSYTIDWLAPSSMPLFVGVEMQKLADEFDGINGRIIWDSTLNLVEPMTKMSMLDGINSSISAVRYGENPLSDIAANAFVGYIGQAVPTIFGQVARTLDDTARTTYVEKTGNLPDALQKALQKNANKIPSLSKNSIAYRDVFGRAEKDTSAISRALQNFISPGYYSEEKIGAMEQELIRLYQETGVGSVVPDSPRKYFNVDGERKDLTAQEYDQYKYTRGSLMYSNLSELTESKMYRNLDDTDKAAVVSDVIEFSNAVAKTEVSDYKLDGWYADVQDAKNKGISVPEFVVIRHGVNSIKGYKDKDGDSVKNSSGINKMYYLQTETNLTEEQRKYVASMFNVGKTVLNYSPGKVAYEYEKLYNEYGR